jgi:hypothetical protein
MEDRCRPTTRLVFELIAIEKINSKDEQLYILQMVAESPHNNYIKQQRILFLSDIQNKENREANHHRYGEKRCNLVHCVINFEERIILILFLFKIHVMATMIFDDVSLFDGRINLFL